MPYEYVDDTTVNKSKQTINKLISDVQTELKGKFTFTYYYIGSASRHFVTREKVSSEGFDIDCNLVVHYEGGTKLDEKKTRNAFIMAINKYVSKYGFDTIKEGSKVITIRLKDKNPKTTYSCDFAIYSSENGNDNDFNYLFFDKKTNNYIWQTQGKSHKKLFKRQDVILSDGNHVNELKDYYLKQKNHTPNQKSCTIYAASINHIWQLYFAPKPKR